MQQAGNLPMNVVLSVSRKVIVNDQGNLLDIYPTSLRKENNLKSLFNNRQEFTTLHMLMLPMYK